MIPSRAAPWLGRALGWFVRRRLEGAFNALRITGLADVRRAAENAPLLLVGNHTSWWDGLVMQRILRGELGLDGIAFMDAKNLRRLPFLRWLGGFGVDVDDPRDVLAGLRHGASHLSLPGRALAIFPQGEERPITLRPLGFRRGAEHLAKMAPDATIVCFALRYEHGKRERADVHTAFAIAEDRTTVGLEGAVTALLDAIDRRIVTGPDASAALWDHTDEPTPRATRLLAWVAGRSSGVPPSSARPALPPAARRRAP